MSPPKSGAKSADIGQDQAQTGGNDGERPASPISQFSPTPPPNPKPSPPSSIRSVRSTAKTTRSFVQTLKGAAKAATYAIGQGRPTSSKAGKAKEMDTSSDDERDITPTKHHASKAGDSTAARLAAEQRIFEETPVENFLGCEFKAAAYTEKYDILGWILHRSFQYPNTDVHIYLPVDIPFEQMQGYDVPQCIVRHLTNAGSDENPHWILAGDANPFIPVHRVGAVDDDAQGETYTSPEREDADNHEASDNITRGDPAKGQDDTHASHEAPSGGPTEESKGVKVEDDWSMSPMMTYRTPSVGLTGQTPTGTPTTHIPWNRSMSPHRYMSPTPAPTGPTPPGNQLAVFPQVTTPFSLPIIPSRGSVHRQPDQIDSNGNRYSFGVSQTPQVPDNNWHAFARDESRNVALKGQNITNALREGVKGKKHILTPYPKGDNLYIRSWDEVKVVSRDEYMKAGGKSGKFMSWSYGSDTLPDVPQAAFVEKDDTAAWAAWSVEAMRNINFINDFGRYDVIARGDVEPSQFDRISVFTTEQRQDMVAMLIQLMTSIPTEPTTEQDWLRSINRTMPWMYKEEAEDLAMRTIQIEAAVRSTDRACDYIQKDYMAFAGAQNGQTLAREWKKWSRQFFSKYGYANTWKKDPLQPSIPQVWASVVKGQKLKDIDISGKPEPHQVVQRMVAQYLPEQKATKSNIPPKPTYSIRETSAVMDAYDRVMHATSHLARKFQVEIVNTMALGTATNPINVDEPSSPKPPSPPPPPIPEASTRPPRPNKNNPPSAIILSPPGPKNTQLPSPVTTAPPPPPTTSPRGNDNDGKIDPPDTTGKGAKKGKSSYVQAVSRSVPPVPKPRTWAPILQKTEKMPKKEERTVFHDRNIVKTLAPSTLIVRTVTNDPKHVEAISNLISTKKDAILALDPNATVIDQGKKHLVIKAATPALAATIVKAFNEITADYAKQFNENPKYANLFAASTKVQNTAYITTATNKTDMDSVQYTGRQLLDALKLNKALKDKIFVSLPQFIGHGEFTCMLSFNVVEFGGDRNSLEETRILIHDGVSTIMKRKFKTSALFCVKCSRWGHAVWSPCHATVISCNICAGLHPTNRHSPAYDKALTKCMNCNGAHTADSRECPCFINRHDVWELRNILEKASMERKAAAKGNKAATDEDQKAKDDMDLDQEDKGFEITSADEVDGWSKTLRVVSLNCQKSARTIQQFLERTCDTNIDLILIQEAPYVFLKTITSSTRKEGDDYHGLPIHPAFKLIENADPDSRIAAYVSKRLTQAKIMHHHKLIAHPDLMLISFKANGEQTFILNIYNDRDDRALSYLLSHPNLPHITLIMGDFNISDERWDKYCHTTNPWTRKLDDLAVLTYTDVCAPEKYTHPPRHDSERPSTIDFTLVSIDRTDDAKIEVDHDLQTDSNHRTIQLILDRITTERTTRKVLSRIKPDEDTPSPRDQFVMRMVEALNNFHPDLSTYLELV
ncbi:hypothetical protein AX16_006721 [Volvariella volvacea WC 439]|nr:hypothetical protein AX16_006721 [Volvariella volvacea WC 439]